MRGLPFRIPGINPLRYNTGPQVNSPGETVTQWGGSPLHAIPWPGAVQSLNVLKSFPGAAFSRAVIPVNTQTAPLPENYLFIGGIVGKSEG